MLLTLFNQSAGNATAIIQLFQTEVIYASSPWRKLFNLSAEVDFIPDAGIRQLFYVIAEIDLLPDPKRQIYYIITEVDQVAEWTYTSDITAKATLVMTARPHFYTRPTINPRVTITSVVFSPIWGTFNGIGKATPLFKLSGIELATFSNFPQAIVGADSTQAEIYGTLSLYPEVTFFSQITFTNIIGRLSLTPRATWFTYLSGPWYGTWNIVNQAVFSSQMIAPYDGRINILCQASSSYLSSGVIYGTIIINPGCTWDGIGTITASTNFDVLSTANFNANLVLRAELGSFVYSTI